MQTLHSLSLSLFSAWGHGVKNRCRSSGGRLLFFCLTTLGFPFLPFRSITFFGGLFFFGATQCAKLEFEIIFFRADLSSSYPAWKEKQNTSCPGLLFCSCRKAHSEKQAFIWRLFCAVFRRKGGEKSVEGTTSEWEKRGGRQRDKTRRSRKGHLKEGSKQKRVSLTCGMGFNKIYFTKKSTQTYCQLEGTSGKKGKLCDMFETVC